MARTVARARQSQLVTTFGVGSLFPAAEQSFIICGTDAWDERRAVPVDEPRLARSLGVTNFRSPPAGGSRGDVPVARFPLMHFCSSCHRLGDPRTFAATADRMVCDQDDRELTPSRFVACCANGHMQDFPYFSWVHSGQEWDPSKSHGLSITTRGQSSTLKDIVIDCSCGVRPVTMAGAFDRAALWDVSSCKGRKPWLLDSDDDGDCDEMLRGLQRASSNVWFPIVRSTISIPPWSGASARLVDRYWDVFKHLDGGSLQGAVSAMLVSHPSASVDSVLSLVARRRGLDAGSPPTDAELRQEEYDALCDGNSGATGYDNFLTREHDVDVRIADLVAQVVEVSRLREVRALEGFTRVTPPNGAADPRKAPLSAVPLPWLPATEVLGEGIFVRFDESVVGGWVATELARQRAARLTSAQLYRDRAMERPESPPVEPRMIVLHSVAHLLLKELSLDAGYPVASLRERVYAAPRQAGILIYTASSDSAGSLGGLAALAEPGRFAVALRAAAVRASWCSNDPVCAEASATGSDGLNLAACHACLLLPETSCEHRNQLLDRVSALGTSQIPSVGLLGGWIPAGAPFAAEHAVKPALIGAWRTALDMASPAEAALLEQLAAAGGVSSPTIGDEGPGGVPLSLAWPRMQLTVEYPGLDESSRDELIRSGWVVVEPTVEAITKQLASEG